MKSQTRKRVASLGLEIPKTCVLEVLYEQAVSGSPEALKQDEIRQRLGIPATKPIAGQRVNRFTAGVLEHLTDQGCVQYLGNGNWKIREKGVLFIEGRGSEVLSTAERSSWLLWIARTSSSLISQSFAMAFRLLTLNLDILPTLKRGDSGINTGCFLTKV